MKSLLFIALTLAAYTTTTFASSKHDYGCIADTLEAYNSDIYYDLSAADIDELLQNSEDARAWKVISVARECDALKESSIEKK